MAVAGGEHAAGIAPNAHVPATAVPPTLVPANPDLDVRVSQEPDSADHGAGTADEIGQREDLQRRLADQQLRNELAAHGFAGRRYQRFETELARYGMSVLRGWLHSAYIFKLTADRGFHLHPNDDVLDELHRDPDARDELAAMTVAVALPQFREQALVGGGWRYDRGASLTTYFMGSCLNVFPNEFRKWRAQRQRWNQQNRSDTNCESDYLRDPAELAVSNLHAREYLDALDPRTRAIVDLTIDGYSQEEIVELLREKSVRAVEGVLSRWRTKARKHRRGEQWTR
jgi:hypothetical protein